MPSIQERLQQAREAGERAHPVSLAVPGYRDGALVLRYSPPGWAASRDYIRTQTKNADTSAELIAIANGLLSVSIGAEAHIDGEVHELPHSLGTNLAEYLGLDVSISEGAGQRRVSDREAVFLLIPDDLDLVTHWNELIARSRPARAKVEKEILGESQAS